MIAQGSREEIFRWPPSRQVALLTGCKNFSRAQARDAHCMEAIDWGCSLRVAREIPSQIAEVAIRAHHIGISPGAAANPAPAENTFPCWVAAASEAPFHVTLYLRLHARSADPSDYHLQVEITQEQWAEVKSEPLPWFAQLDRRAALPASRLAGTI